MGRRIFLPDNYIKGVENKTHEIASILAETAVESEGLMGGAAGQACFCAYYADYSGSQLHKELSINMIERAVNPPDGHQGRYSFSEGLAGIGWTIDHLARNKLLDFDGSDIYHHLDDILFEAMMQEIKSGHYDYLHGALGISLYFLRDTTNEKYRSYLAELVKELKEQAIIDTDGSISWSSVLDGDAGLKGVNLSLSHGMASIIIILTKLLRAGIEKSLCTDLVMGAVRYLEKQRLDAAQYLSIFPSWGVESREDHSNSRLAWCYGDLGISLAYMEAGQHLKDYPFRMDGLEMLIKTSIRRDLKENNVHDAGICHGAAGIALTYNVLFQRTGRESLAEAAMYWLDVSLNMAGHEDGLAGYKAWYHPEYGGWKACPGLLEGVAGIGLMLMSFISEKEAAWTDCLLLN